MWARNLAESIVHSLRVAWNFLNQPIPQWLKNICTTIAEIVFSLLKQAGKEYLSQIESKIEEIAKDYPDLSGDEKFLKVWDFAHTLLPDWKESSIDTVIQNLFIKLKFRYRV